MSTINDGGPAFPCTASDLNNPAPGMSLRAYFAGQALAGMLANPHYDDETPGGCAFDAVAVADALIAKLAEVKE